MPAALVLAVVMVAGLAWMLRGNDRDAPARIVAIAAHLLPAHRREWGRAMTAELARIHGRSPRWRFTAGVLRVVVFPPSGHRNRVLAVAVVGLTAAAAATVAAARDVPSLSLFTAVLGLLLSGYATVVTARTERPRLRVPRAIAGALALAGVGAAVATVTAVAAAHPAATTDGTHVFSVLFALILTGYLALALTPPRRGGHTDTTLWWALACALACGAAWSVKALTTPVTPEGITGYLSPAAIAATLVASIGASAATRSRQAGTQAGLLTAILGAPMHFAIDMSALLGLHHYTLTTPYDVAAYPHSGYPDVASYLLSDALAGHILSLALSPLALFAFALSGAAAGAGLQRVAARRTPA